MANPNPQIWGNTESWIYAPRAYGLQTETAEQGNYAKPKVANFDDTESGEYKGSLYAAITSGKMTLNNYIDDTICPCGQDPTVSPWGRIAVFNENNDFSLTPSSVQTFYDQNINWFFADRAANIPAIEGYAFDKNYVGSYPRGLQYQQYAPKAISPVSKNNVNFQLSPYVYYGIKSLVLSIEVQCALKGATQVITGTTWTSLDNWRDTYKDTHDICGLRLFVRNCMSHSSNTFVYNDDKAISTGKASYIGITNKLNILNANETTPTQFFDRFNPNLNERCVYIFSRTSDVYNEGTFHNRGLIPCWDYFTGQTINKYKYSGSPTTQIYYYYMIPYSEDTYNKCLSIAALFGCYFTPTNKYTFGDTMTDNDLYLSIVDENGVTHGEYTRGSANANNSLYTITSIRDIDYDPSKPVDPNTYSNTTGFNSLSSSAAMTRRYVLNAANVEKLGDDLWSICNDLATGGDFEYFDGKLKDEFLTTNPIDSIISLQRFPFSIPHTFAPSKSAVRLGKTDGSAQGYLTNNPFNTIVFKGIDIFARFGNCFLDYEPFTSYELYVPFCGTTKIRASDIIGHKLNLTMQIDLMTGNCTAYIMADQLVIETLNGSCGVDMQLSGIQSATVAANLYNGILGQQQAKTNMLAQGASALLPSSWVNPVGYAAKGEQAETTYKQATYAIEHTETPVHSIGSASALLAWVQEFDARLIIYYPEGDVINSDIPPSFNDSALAAFGHLKGFATVDPGKVSNYQMREKAAFLQGDILAENIPCTQSERNKIKAFFAEGVYLPPIS